MESKEQVTVAKDLAYSDNLNDKSQGIALLQQYANGNNADALHALGLCYYDGEGVKQDFSKAFELWTQAAQLGNTDSLIGLAFCYKDGEGTEKDLDKSLELFTKAAVADNAEACWRLAEFYEDGTFGEGKEELAASFMKRGVELGATGAKRRLARWYYDGVCVAQDYDKAERLMNEAANEDNEIAQWDLAFWYQTGNGVDMDKQRAFELYKKSAENGFVYAQKDLADCYYNGDGIEADLSLAVEWMERAADNDDDAAMESLGEWYHDDERIRDYEKAFLWIKKAAAKDNVQAKYCLGVWLIQGNGIEEDCEQGFSYVRSAAEAGSIAAMEYLSRAYLNGWGTDPNPTEAVKWAEKASELGYGPASLLLADIYGKGQTVSRDANKELYYYKLSAAQGSIAGASIYGDSLLTGKLPSGELVNADFEEGKRWLLEAAENNDKKAIFDLYLYYKDGEYGFPIDHVASFGWLKHLCEIEPTASISFLLGKCYENGDGTEENPTEAFAWIKKSVELPGGESHNKFLAEYYTIGYGTNKDIPKARELFEKDELREKMTYDIFKAVVEFNDLKKRAKQSPTDYDLQYKYALECIARGENEEAIPALEEGGNNYHENCLGLLVAYYEDEKRPEQYDISKANYWREKLSMIDVSAGHELYQRYKWGVKGTPIDEKKAFSIMKRCWEMDPTDTFSQTWLGLDYIDGSGTPKDVEKGIGLIKQAAANNDGHAMERLALMYCYGLGSIEQNFEKAEEYAIRSKANGYKDAEKTLKRIEDEKKKASSSAFDREPKFGSTVNFSAIICFAVALICFILTMSSNVYGLEILTAPITFVWAIIAKKKGQQVGLCKAAIVISIIGFVVFGGIAWAHASVHR